MLIRWADLFSHDMSQHDLTYCPLQAFITNNTRVIWNMDFLCVSRMRSDNLETQYAFQMPATVMWLYILHCKKFPAFFCCNIICNACNWEGLRWNIFSFSTFMEAKHSGWPRNFHKGGCNFEIFSFCVGSVGVSHPRFTESITFQYSQTTRGV